MKRVVFPLLVSALVIGTSIYSFKVPGLSGGTIDFSKFKGKKIMIVNTASRLYVFKRKWTC